MAGEWIPIDCNLAHKPEVLELLDETGEPIEVIVYRLIQLWSWAALNTADGTLRATPKRLAHVAGGDESFWLSVQQVGWIEFSTDCVTIAGWEKRFSKSAKARAMAAKRQDTHRKKVAKTREKQGCNASVTVQRDKCAQQRNGPPSPQDRTRQDKTGEKKLFDTHTARESENEFSAGWATDEWSRFSARWNATDRASPWKPLVAPSSWVEHAASPGWLDRAYQALDHLPSCQWFSSPLAVTRFFVYVDRILAGEFDNAKQQTQQTRENYI
jgi:hypothetical protein